MPQTTAQYQPTSRRPIADVFRRTAHGTVRLCIRAGIHPDAVSYGSMVAAGLAAVCFWQAGRHPWLLLIGPGFCYLRLWCNMLDGMVALASGKASWRGEILNDLPDRVSDILIFAGVAHSGLNAPAPAYWAALMAVLTAYVGMMGQAVGVQREFSGIMAKPWRMVVLHVGAWVTLGLMVAGRGMCWHGLSVLDWTCVVVIGGCVQTIAVRLHRIMGALRAKQGPRA
jgi:phosphatidylglycerophosphate synthase